MSLFVSADQWLVAITVLLLLFAALEDGWRSRISNVFSGGVALAAFAAIALDGPIIGLWQNILLFAAVLVVGTMLFARGVMGGGDIKLMAASALWFDLSSGWKLLVAIAIAGGLEALIVLALRQIIWPAELSSRFALLRRREGIPYGIAIAAGVILMAWWQRA
jgi:prepilin peptidase CpaA